MRVHFPEPIYFIIIPREEVTVAVKHWNISSVLNRAVYE